MEKISDTGLTYMTKTFPTIWLGIMFFMILVSGFNIMPVAMFVGGAIWFYYLSTRLCEVYFDEENVCIKKKDQSVSIPIANIAPPVEPAQVLAGSYRIRFINNTELGHSVVFVPRSERVFFKHRACKRFLKLVNT